MATLHREIYGEEDPERKLSIWWVYAFGLVLWAASWGLIFGGVALHWFPEDILIDAHNQRYFAVSVAFGAIFFASNLWLWRRPGKYADHDMEHIFIDSVERNSSWFLVASGAFLGGGAFYFGSPLEGASTPFVTSFVTFISLSILSLLPSIMLYWIPYASPRDLAVLRHMKMVPFGFGVGFFSAAVIALLLSVQALTSP